MKVDVIKKSTEFPAFLQCWIGASYWEDTSFNGEDDTENADFLRNNFPESFFLSHEKIGYEPVKKDMERYNQDYLYLEINLETGVVLNWPKGVTADFHYKSCDMNYFRLLNKKYTILAQTPEGDSEYVIGPSFMNEWGDYFVLRVNEEGYIINYDVDEMEAALQEWINGLSQ